MERLLLLKIFAVVVLMIIINWTVTLGQTPLSSELMPPFPLDHPEATYTIDLQDGNYVVKYQYGSRRGVMMVGESLVELEPYLGKEVKIDGRFPRSISDYSSFEAKQQCIAGRCKPLFPSKEMSAFVVHIQALRSSN
jgi:hypothetical protein